MPGRSRPRFAILARDCADMPQWHASCLEGSLTSPVLHRAKVNDASIARLPKPQEKAEADGNRTRPPGINRRTGFEDWCVLQSWSIPLARTFASATVQDSAKDLCV